MPDIVSSSFDTTNAAKDIERLLRDGKNRHNDTEREQFSQLWLALVKSEGIAPEGVRYLLEGFEIAGAEPLYRYASNAGGEEVYKKFFMSNSVFQDNQATLRIALSLMAYELMRPTTEDSLDFVARRVCDAAMRVSKRSRSPIKTSLVQSLLVRPLSQGRVSEYAHLESAKSSSLSNCLYAGLDGVIKGKNPKPENVRAANELIEWLKSQKVMPQDAQAAEPVPEERQSVTGVLKSRKAEESGVATANIDSDAAAAGGDSMSLEKGGVSVEEGATQSATPSENTKGSGATASKASSKKAAKKRETAKEKIEADSLDLATVIAFLSTLEQEDAEREKQYESSQSKCHDLSVKVSDLEQKLRASQKEVEDLTRQRSSLSGNYLELQQQYDALKADNHLLHEQLDDANEMIAIMDEGVTHEADATMSSLGMELAHDYRKFLDAASQPMTEELGGIVLRQLHTVFEILKKHGLDLQ